MKKYLIAIVLIFMLISTNLLADEWFENFDSVASGSYVTGNVVVSGRTWTAKDAGNFSYANSNMGSYAFTINDDKAGAYITTPALNTIGTVSFKYAYINGSDTNVFILQKSYDNSSFTNLDTHTLGSNSNLNYVDYSFNVDDNASQVYLRILSDNQNAHLFIEDFTVTNYSAGSNSLPSITNIAHSPSTDITSSTTVSVSADITDDSAVAGAELHWGIESGVLSNTIEMSLSSGDTYITDSDIPLQLDGTTVYYEVYAIDDELEGSTSVEYYYTVSDPQPLVTDFEASSIEVYVDENISFSNLSTGGIADFTFAWDFDGDNTVDSTEENPIYSYSSVGTYTVTLTVTDANLASDDEIKINYINVLEAPNVASDLFISEYIEGSSNNKVLEIFNGTGAPVALANYSIKISYNANPFTSEYNLSNVTTTLANNDVIVIANPSSNAQILALADATNSILGGNGDDAYGLFKNGSLIDIVGKESEDPGTAWPVAGVSNATADHTLIRKSSVYGPTTDWNLSAGSNSTDSQWIVNNQDDISDLGSHTFDGTGVEEGTVASPLITPESGEYINQVEVSITCETEGATIYYTIDGTDPTTASTQYTTAFTLTQSATVKAFAVKSGNTDSFISEAVFTISAPDPLVADFSADTISITVGSQVSFTDMTTGGIPEYLYSWDLDGDGEEDSTIANPSFTYNAVGTYTVELLVYDQELSESTERKVDYINVYSAASEPTIGTLFISEVSDATNYSNEYIELYNRGSQLLSLENITLRMDTNTNFALNNVSYVGDITIQPNGYMIITRGASRATFEAEFGLLGTGVSFLQGSGSMYFGSSPRRWQLVLITEAKAEIIIDDTIEAVGGSGNTSYQASPGTWVTDVFANNTPGAATDDQTLPVSFSSFMVNQTVDNFAQLEWVTQSEHEVAGYNIYRNTNDEVATAIQINDKMITAYNEATTRTYTFIDDEIEVNSSYYYWIESKDFDASSVLFGPVVIKISENDDSQDIVIPSKTLLKNVYPNPFNPSTRVNFYMDKADDVKIRVFNVRGQLISNLTEANYGEGFHNVLWDGKDLDGKDCASGIYFFRMETSEQNQMIKGILMK